MKIVAQISAVLAFACMVPALATAEPFQIVSGSFGIGRPLIGTSAGSAALTWFNLPIGAFETATRQHVSVVSAVWDPPDGFSSTLLGATAPVFPLQPGPVPVRGSFRADGGASLSFEGSTDPTVPFLNQSIDLGFSGGTFNVPAVFPPTDSEGLYLLTAPFTMNGTWTVWETEQKLFSGDLRAAGTAFLVLYGDHQTGSSLISQVFYDFSEPVPEPATLALVGMGCGMLAIRRRRRRGPAISVVAAVKSRAGLRASAVFGIVLLPAVARAEPFAITAGHLGFRWNASVDFVGLSGPDFAIPIADSNPEDFGLPGLDIEQTDPLTKTFPVSGHMLLSASGPLTLTGRPLPDQCCRYLLFDLLFVGNPVLAQPTADGIAGTGVFRVTGDLRVFTTDTDEVFEHIVAGRGVATVGFRFSQDDTPRPFATYQFEPTITPEPSTLLLAAYAAVAAAWRTRSRRSARLSRPNLPAATQQIPGIDNERV